jgi:hypothetical protein
MQIATPAAFLYHYHSQIIIQPTWSTTTTGKANNPGIFVERRTKITGFSRTLATDLHCKSLAKSKIGTPSKRPLYSDVCPNKLAVVPIGQWCVEKLV